jgi:ubiquinol oxidase
MRKGGKETMNFLHLEAFCSRSGMRFSPFFSYVQVARMPYFSYTTCLHLYETLGWWRTGGLRLVHFAEEWNELHHLLIMESLGGDRKWQDRFLGQHAAVFYYWALVICFLVSPKWSYKFSEMLESVHCHQMCIS